MPYYVDGNFRSFSVVDRLPKVSYDTHSAHVLWVVEWGFEIMAINLSKFVWIFLWSCVAFLPLISPQDVCRWNWVQFQKNNGQRRILGVIFLEHFSIHILIWPWYFWVSELLQDIPYICHGRHGWRPCKIFLAGVNFYRFNAKNWQFTV